MSFGEGFLSDGSNQYVQITTQGGQTVIETVDVIDGFFERSLDATSQSELVLATNSECCDRLSRLSLGQFEVEWWVDDCLSWAGPIRQIAFGINTMTITASDLTSWWAERLLPTIVHTGVDTTDIFVDYHNAAMRGDPVRGFGISPRPTGKLVSAAVEIEECVTAADVMNELADADIDYTAYGRNILIGPQELSTVPTITLCDDDFFGNFQVLMRGGENFATKIIAKSANGLTCFTEPDPVLLSTYGLHERVIEFEFLEDKNLLQRAAESALELYSQPYYIDTGSDAGLRPGAPIPFKALIPGLRVNLVTSSTCLDIDTVLRLYKVRRNADGTTSIGLEPIGSIGSDG